MPQIIWDASFYDQKHSFVFEFGKGLVSLLDPQPGERILDVGCGTGHLTYEIAERGAHVTGIDNARTMIETARQTYPTLTFQVADAQDFSFTEPFDAVFSNAALHWINDQERAVRCIALALKPGGRLVAEFGGKGNVATILTAAQEAIFSLAGKRVESGWFFPSIGEYASLLEKYGLETRSALLYERPTRLEEGEQGLRNWLSMFGEHLVAGLDDTVRELVIRQVEERTRPLLYRDGSWLADYRRLRLIAYKVEAH